MVQDTAWMVIKIGTESGTVTITNEGGTIKVYKETPMRKPAIEKIEGVLGLEQLTMFQSQASPGCVWVYNPATRTWTQV